MKIFAMWAILTSGLYILQTSFLPMFSYNGVSVNLVLLLTVSVAFLLGHRWGVFMGFAVGLLQDLTLGNFFGCNIFSYMLIGLLCGKFSDHVFKEQLIMPFFASLVSTLMYYFMMISFLYLLGYQLDLKWSMQYTLIPMLCYQFVFAYPVNKLVFDFNNYTKKYK